jgi:hypothetical protein
LQGCEIIKLQERTVVKCANQDFIMRFITFLNNIWSGEELTESWLKAIIIPVHKKRNMKQCEN